MNVNDNKQNNKKLSKGDVLRRYYSTRTKHYLYGVVSFLMTAMFYITFTSPEFISRIVSGAFNDSLTALIWAVLGFLFSVSITVLIMHSHTTDTQRGKTGAYILIIGLGIVFNVFTETASTMDRVDERVTVKSEQSGLFKALISKVTHSSGQANTALTKAKNDYADAISTAKARCKHGANYSARLCRKWSMRADEYKTAIELHKDGASSELKETVKEAKEAGHNTEYAQMIVKIMMQKLGLSFLTATALISMFIIITFEILGIMIGGDYRVYREMLPEYGIDLHSDLEIKYLKGDLARQRKKEEALNKYSIQKAKLELKRLADARTTQKEIYALKRDIKRYTSSTPEQVIAQNNEAPYSVNKGSFMGFIDTDSKKTVTPNKTGVTEYPDKDGNIPTSKKAVITDYANKDVIDRMERMKALYLIAQNAKSGEQFKCPTCKKQLIKKGMKIFCSNSRNKKPDGSNCADEYKNIVKPERLKALANKRRKQQRKG